MQLCVRLAFVLVLATLVDGKRGPSLFRSRLLCVSMCVQPKLGEPDSDSLSDLYSEMESTVIFLLPKKGGGGFAKKLLNYQKEEGKEPIS